MRIVIGILIVYCVNLFGCAFYCHQKKRKAVIQTAQDSVNGSQNAKNDNVEEKTTLNKYLRGGINKLFSSLLRLNLALTAKIPSHHIRMLLYRCAFAMSIAKKAVIYYGAEIRSPWMISIGEGTVIGDKAILDGRSRIRIGKNVNFSTGVWLWTLQHDVNDPLFTTVGQGAPIVIGDRAWLSCRTVILPGVSIGEGSVVAAGAVVTQNTEPFSINGGVPSRKIGNRSHDLKYEFDGGHVHFL